MAAQSAFWSSTWKPKAVHSASLAVQSRSKSSTWRSKGLPKAFRGPTWTNLGPIWSIFGALATLKTVLSCRRELNFHVFAVLAFNKTFLDHLGASWAPLGLNLDALGRLLGLTWTLLGPTWTLWVPTWAHLGPAWTLLEPIGRTWSQLGRSSAALQRFRKSRRVLTKTCHAQQDGAKANIDVLW